MPKESVCLDQKKCQECNELFPERVLFDASGIKYEGKKHVCVKCLIENEGKYPAVSDYV